jgi:hypothetical protein
VLGGYQRSVGLPGAWVAVAGDLQPTLHIEWASKQKIQRLDVFFDADYDHALESVLMRHPDSVSPYCVKAFQVLDDAGRELARADDWHHGRWTCRFETSVETTRISIQILSMNDPNALPSVYQVRAYA